jgi:NAD(P)-dependent dehydrogenase (short-subunit alcohol dehydrogenase family)
MRSARNVTVFGAYGHTGRFVVSELRRRGWSTILSGRDPAKLAALGAAHPHAEIRPAPADDPASLDAAIAGAAAVINCAGPFATTAAPVIEAALRARIPYLDVAAEIEANADTFEQFSDRARDAGIVIVPAMAFYGGLGDLLATAAIADWPAADEICIAYGLDRWRPTSGTRIAGQVSRQRRDGRRIVFSDGRFEYRTDRAPVLEWTFPPPLGAQPVIGEFTMADTLTISRHLPAPQIRSYMTRAAVDDLSDPDVSPPEAADESGRSAQTFLGPDLSRRGGRAPSWRRASRGGERTRHLRDQRTPGGRGRSARRHRAGQGPRSLHSRGGVRRARLPHVTQPRASLTRARSSAASSRQLTGSTVRARHGLIGAACVVGSDTSAIRSGWRSSSTTRPTR